MALGVVLLVLAGFVGIAFWIFVGISIFKLITKKSVKKYLITCGILAFFWVAIVSVAVGMFVATKKDSIASAIPMISYESARQNWSQKILKKTSGFELSLDKIEVIRSEKEWLTSTDEQKASESDAARSEHEKNEELLGLGNATSYELTVVVDNKGNNGSVKYKELRKSNLCYVQDDNGVFIPAYIINHAEFDDVPWILTFFLPQYKKEQKVEYVPLGKSYLNVRVEVPSGHKLSKFIFGNATLDIDADAVKQ